MNAFYNLKIATKLVASFTAVLVLTAFLGIFSLVQVGKVNQLTTELATDWMPSARALLEFRVSVARYRTVELQHILSTTEAEMDNYEKSMSDTWATLQKQRADVEKFIDEPEEKPLYADIVKALEQTAVVHARLIALSRAQHIDEAKLLIRGESLKYNRELNTSLDKLVELNMAGAAAADDSGDKLYAGARAWILGILVGSIALGLALAFTIARVVSRPLSQAVDAAQRVAAGDLTSRIEVTSKDETGQLMQALKDMNDSLVGIVGNVRSGTDTIATASNQIAAGNHDLSSRTEEQASSLEETAASMEELTSTVKQNADNARQANQLAVSASSVAVKGGSVVADGRRHHGRNQCVVAQDCRHHWCHRRHCLPDQHPGAQCGSRSRARRRAGPWLCGGGCRGAQPGAAQRGSGQGNQDPDRRLGRQGRRRQQAGRRSRQDHGRDRRQRQTRD
jgi:methyl-accepting chemotaxis protein